MSDRVGGLKLSSLVFKSDFSKIPVFIFFLERLTSHQVQIHPQAKMEQKDTSISESLTYAFHAFFHPSNFNQHLKKVHSSAVEVAACSSSALGAFVLRGVSTKRKKIREETQGKSVGFS